MSFAQFVAVVDAYSPSRVRRLAVGALVALTLAWLTLIWIPGCGWVDVWIYITYGCEAAGGGGSGAS